MLRIIIVADQTGHICFEVDSFTARLTTRVPTQLFFSSSTDCTRYCKHATPNVPHGGPFPDSKQTYHSGKLGYDTTKNPLSVDIPRLLAPSAGAEIHVGCGLATSGQGVRSASILNVLRVDNNRGNHPGSGTNRHPILIIQNLTPVRLSDRTSGILHISNPPRRRDYIACYYT